MPLTLNRRTFLQSSAAAGVFVASGAQAQSAWPDRPVKIVVPYPAGGSTDVLARILAEHLKETFGQPFMIENRPGAGGNIGIAAVTTSAPDGYTLGAATVGHFAINQFLYKSMPFDPERDMVPASMTWELPNVFVVATDHVPAKTVAEFIDWARKKGKVSFGSPGVGTSPHLSGVLFAARAKLDAVHVPFRGAALAVHAGGADHGGSRRQGFRRHLMGRLHRAGGYAAPAHRQDRGGDEKDFQRRGAAETLRGRRRALHRLDAGRGDRVRQQGARHVEGCGGAVGAHAAVRMEAR